MRSLRAPLTLSAACLALAGANAMAQPGNGNGNNKGGQNHAAPQKAGNAKAAPSQAAAKAPTQKATPNKGNGNAVDAHDKVAATKKSAPAAQKPATQNKTASQARPSMTSPVKAEAQRQSAQKAPANKAASKNDNERWVSDRENTGKTAQAPTRQQRADVKRVTYSGPAGKKVVVPTNDRVRVVTTKRSYDWSKLRQRTNYDGCPPGLAKKYNGCTPPGLAKPATYTWSQPSWYLRDYDRDYRYRYADGYMLRLGSGTTVLSYIPLLGGALAVGQVWPGTYQPVALPTYYDTYYGLGSDGGYRYYDQTIYRVDPDTAAIQAVVALLTGNDITIGQPMPMGYEVYNVPYGYRDQYYDGPDALYRYSDGYVYQLDPTTRLVQAAIELLS